jgi:Cu+-exporting ATPase
MEESEKKIHFQITGMHCANCAKNIEKILLSQKNITSAQVQFGNETASIVYNSSETSVQRILESVIGAGYGVVDQKVSIAIGGMHCASCAAKIRDVLLKINWVIDANVNPSTETALLTVLPGLLDMQQLRTTVEQVGFEYRGSIEEQGADEVEMARKHEQNQRLYRIIAAFVTSVPLMILMYLPNSPVHHYPIYQLIFAAPFFFFVSWPIFKAGFKDLMARSLSMDVMYCMGIGTAFIASLLGTFNILLSHQFIMYDTAIMLAGFLSLGRFLEARARGRTSDSVKKLIGLQPRTALVIRDNKEMEVNIEDVIVNDTVFVKPGDKIPVDGLVIDGESTVDESMITGESVPVNKKKGASLIGGTINRNGILTFTATRIGKDTVLSQIVKLVQEAQGSRPPIQRIADKAVSWFIPVVLSIAIAAFLVWYFIVGSTLLFSLTTLIAVLVIACPCALGLASPTAVTVGIGRGAELGILIKNGEALEKISTVNAVVFDKTGTLTQGTPSVTDIAVFNGTEEKLLSLVGSVEKNTNHPLADAIVRKGKEKNAVFTSVTEFDTIEGRGVKAIVDGSEILVGSVQLLDENKIDVILAAKYVNTWQSEAKSVVLISKDGLLYGAIAVMDPIRGNSKTAVRQLKKMGIEVVMISGDNKKTAGVIANQLGIDHVRAEVLPGDKAAEIVKMQKENKIVIFVGDGINDAPALAQADVGVAIGSGSDIALESGDIVLVKSDPLDSVAAIQLGNKLYSRIKLNLFWAFAYNTALIPLAAGVFYPLWGIVFKPEFAGFAMALSSVTVVTLSLMLKGFTPSSIKEKMLGI